MALDRISEEIAHFAGKFHLEIEAAKLRLEYEAFQAKNAAPTLLPLSETPATTKSEPLPKDPSLGHGHADLPAQPLASTAPSLAPPPVQWVEAQAPTPSSIDVPVETPDVPLTIGGGASGPAFQILPNSVVSVVSQSAELTDDDRLIFDGSADFVEPVAPQALIALAQSLAPLAPWVWGPAADDAHYAAMDLAEAMIAVTASGTPGVITVILHDGATEGTFVNGAAVETAPSLEDLMPAFLRPEDTEAGAQDRPSDGVTDQDGGPFQIDPGHHVVTGGNTVINEAIVKSVWVDAPVIVVAENVVRLDIIAQVNLHIEACFTPDHAMPAISTSLNIAQMEQISSLSETAASTEASLDGAPAFWNVTRVEGDLLLMNWVQQHIFVSDQDMVEVKFSGSATFIGTGGNLAFNEMLGLTLGFHYDLILIGGNLISVNQINQINVLLDQDSITGDVPAGAGLLTGDNLQANKAAITSTGKDTIAEKTALLDAAFAGIASGDSDIPADLAQDPLFAGKAVLNVLYISGDLVQTNVIEQFNYLGDSDQIHFIEDMFSTAAGAEVTVTSGSNAQINTASVISVGLDSTVMAGGEAYSDALIFQAELIDDAAPPAGVQLDALASEAVAFLADGMIDTGAADDAGPGIYDAGSPGAADVMQTVLT